ncbi:hypothetical protein [Persicitalea jodogahamensis]|uniref:Uncharacterized protein n=1 Tax=Persicitalea jodogahamensis TaxID=402147 RepID=A0A8J3D8U1_9BACT|nr:hypothetical protein [Persicitalea jodogahamensis]GHB69601.1 hypothetical protein GCM10007390_24000 [Persicitalea jodogahamensis]
MNKEIDSTVPYFLKKITSLQSPDTKYFPAGLFPAYRRNASIGYARPDTTIFFSAIIGFTLKSLRDKLLPEEQKQVDLILSKIKKNYPDFQNKDGLKTYNFWKTKPSRHFPNGYLFRHFEHFRIPDDVDDTAFVYLTTDPGPEDLRWLKDKLAQHANGSKQWIKNTYPQYLRLKAYSTWFGKNMYVEFDACVLSNILYCLFYYKLPLNQHDAHSLLYIRSVVETDRYRVEPFRCAHQYPSTTLIIYHIARLISAFDPAALWPVKAKLVRDAEESLRTEIHPMNRLLLATSLLRLGQAPPRIAVEKFTEKDFDGFRFFIAGLLTAYESPELYKMASHKIFHMNWTCEAHCWTLLLEYEVLWREKGDQQSPAGNRLV